jgi:predicted transcriptional regulator
MQDVLYIEEVDQAATLLNPLRLDLLKRMAEPRSCPELAEFVGQSPQKVYYHVKALERAGLVNKVGERRIRGMVEGRYQAKGRSYWLSPNLVGRIGGRGRAR